MHTEAPLVLLEWLRILADGGEMQIVVPNLACAAAEILKADADPTYDATLYPLWQVYGRQTGAGVGELHRNGFTRHGLARLMVLCGLDGVTVEVTGEVGENLTGRGRKRATPPTYSIADKWPEHVTVTTEPEEQA
jgi:hypothetical protein